MDVGNPSNMERLRSLLPDFPTLREAVEAYPVDDESIRSQIAKDYQRYGEIWCPHTATAFWVYDQLPAARKSARPWIVSATAHPAKFEAVVEPMIGHGGGSCPRRCARCSSGRRARSRSGRSLAQLATELEQVVELKPIKTID